MPYLHCEVNAELMKRIKHAALDANLQIKQWVAQILLEATNGNHELRMRRDSDRGGQSPAGSLPPAPGKPSAVNSGRVVNRIPKHAAVERERKAERTVDAATWQSHALNCSCFICKPPK